MICPNCGTDNRPGARFCAKCGTSLIAETVAWTPPAPGDLSFAASSPPPPSPPPPIPAGPAQPVEKRYPILRILSIAYKVLGGIFAGLTLLGAIGVCFTGIAGGSVLGDYGLMPDTGGIIGGLVAGFIVLLYGGIVSITLFGAGEMISLFLSMEENIRSLAQR